MLCTALKTSTSSETSQISLNSQNMHISPNMSPRTIANHPNLTNEPTIGCNYFIGFPVDHSNIKVTSTTPPCQKYKEYSLQQTIWFWTILNILILTHQAKHFVPWPEFPHPIFPDYCSGVFYIMSRKVKISQISSKWLKFNFRPETFCWTHLRPQTDGQQSNLSLSREVCQLKASEMCGILPNLPDWSFLIKKVPLIFSSESTINA